MVLCWIEVAKDPSQIVSDDFVGESSKDKKKISGKLCKYCYHRTISINKDCCMSISQTTKTRADDEVWYHFTAVFDIFEVLITVPFRLNSARNILLFMGWKKIGWCFSSYSLCCMECWFGLLVPLVHLMVKPSADLCGWIKAAISNSVVVTKRHNETITL